VLITAPPDAGLAGYALAALDMDADGLHDLVIGAPGEAGTERPGRVYIVWGFKPGVGGQSQVDLGNSGGAADIFSAGEGGDELGFALWADFLPGAEDAPLLIIGAPGHTEKDGAEGGIYTLTGPLTRSSADDAPRTTQDLETAGGQLTGGTEPGARLGSALGVMFGPPEQADSHLLVAGAPGYRDVGSVSIFTGLSTVTLVESSRVVGAEAGSQLGAFVTTINPAPATQPPMFAAGAPYGGTNGGGAVYVFYRF
jgi:hypothetical protein